MLGKWFDRWCEEQCRKAWDNARNGESDINEPKKSTRRRNNKLAKADEDIIQDRACYTIKMQAASGGTVIQVSHYNQTQDEWHNDMFVIDDNRDLGDGIKDILVEYRLKHS